jgi:hypothetical protein
MDIVTLKISMAKSSLEKNFIKVFVHFINTFSDLAYSNSDNVSLKKEKYPNWSNSSNFDDSKNHFNFIIQILVFFRVLEVTWKKWKSHSYFSILKYWFDWCFYNLLRCCWSQNLKNFFQFLFIIKSINKMKEQNIFSI